MSMIKPPPGTNLKDLTSWTQGEMIWLWRKQEGLTGHQGAARLGVGRNTLWDAEGGRRSLPVALPRVKSPDLTTLLQLARKRSGLGLKGTCRRVGVTHPTLLAHERAGDAGLREWWEKRGYQFC